MHENLDTIARCLFHPSKYFERRQKIKRRIFALILTAVLLFCFVGTVGAGAVSVSFERREYNSFLGIGNKNTGAYPSVTVTLGGVDIGEAAYLINDTTYIPLRAAATLAGAKVTYDTKTRTATISFPGLTMTASDGGYIVNANDRALLSKTPVVILSDGRMYMPIRILAKALGLAVSWSPARVVDLTGRITPITPGAEFYDEDELYWMSRIISAESRGEPLLGQLAVGTVVMNRREHKDYPNTIWGVIFDKKHGVQFSPVKDGSIYNTPTYLSVQAAKIVLEGERVSDKILFFLEPTKANSAWIVLNRKYAFTIGNHYFFY